MAEQLNFGVEAAEEEPPGINFSSIPSWKAARIRSLAGSVSPCCNQSPTGTGFFDFPAAEKPEQERETMRIKESVFMGL